MVESFTLFINANACNCKLAELFYYYLHSNGGAINHHQHPMHALVHILFYVEIRMSGQVRGTLWIWIILIQLHYDHQLVRILLRNSDGFFCFIWFDIWNCQLGLEHYLFLSIDTCILWFVQSVIDTSVTIQSEYLYFIFFKSFRMFIKTKSFNMAGTRANKRNFNIIPRTDVTHLSPLYLGKKRKHKQKREKQKYVWGVLIHLFAIITCWLSRRTNRKPSHVTALW